MRTILEILVINILISSSVYSQFDFKTTELELSKYNDYLVNADKYEHRSEANQIFLKLFLNTLQQPNSFDFPFDSLKWISKIIPQDSSFRIFSWQLMKDRSNFNYYGIFQSKDRLFVLTDNNSTGSDMDFEEFNQNNWLGQIYYNIYQYTLKDKNQYLLFGYKLTSDGMKLKFAEPLSINESSLTFGKQIFEDTINKGLFKNRIVLMTSIESNSTLKFDSEISKLIFDHTIKFTDSRSGQPRTMIISDGSYHGFELKGEKWYFISNVFPEKFDAPPITETVKDKTNVKTDFNKKPKK